MNIELRKISYDARLSEETAAYSAQLWVDGAHFADVSNHGHGGCDNQRPAPGRTVADLRALDEKIKATYPKRTYTAGGETHSYDADLETVCSDLLEQHLLIKKLMQWSRTNAVFVVNGDPEGEYRRLRAPYRGPSSPAGVALREKYAGRASVFDRGIKAWVAV